MISGRVEKTKKEPKEPRAPKTPKVENAPRAPKTPKIPREKKTSRVKVPKEPKTPKAKTARANKSVAKPEAQPSPIEPPIFGGPLSDIPVSNEATVASKQVNIITLAKAMDVDAPLNTTVKTESQVTIAGPSSDTAKLGSEEPFEEEVQGTAAASDEVVLSCDTKEV